MSKKICILIFLALILRCNSYQSCNFTIDPFSKTEDVVAIAKDGSNNQIIATKTGKILTLSYPYYSTLGMIQIKYEITAMNYLIYSDYIIFATASKTSFNVYVCTISSKYNSLSIYNTISEAHDKRINNIACSSPRYDFFTASDDKTIKKFRAYSSSVYQTYSHDGPVKFLKYTRQSYYSEYIISATNDTLYFWQFSSKITWKPHTEEITGLAYENSFIVSSDKGGKIVWSAIKNSQGEVNSTYTHSKPIISISKFFNDNFFIVAIDSEGTLLIFDNPFTKLIKKIKTTQQSQEYYNLLGVADESSNENFIIFPKQGKIQVWNITKDTNISSSGLCTTGCAAGYFLDEFYKCKTCDSNCETCQYSSTSCLTCPKSKYLNGLACTNSCPPESTIISNKICQCPAGKVSCGDPKACCSCSKECKTCNKIASNCTSCKTGWDYVFNSNKELYTCTLCGGDNCQKCDRTSYDCVLCKSGYVLSSGQCKLCTIANCLECGTTSTCKTCTPGFYPSYIGYYCYECHKSCLECNDYSRKSCTACRKYHNLVKGECISTKHILAEIFFGILLGSFLFCSILVIIFFKCKYRRKIQDAKKAKYEKVEKAPELPISKHIVNDPLIPN